jgi:hypothetical protein
MTAQAASGGAGGGGAVLERIEQDLIRIPGVMSARIVGDREPTEIHVVATRDRSPKQIVRDVQSLAAARHGLSIDHRIVSIVQLSESEVAATEIHPHAEEDHRPLLDRVVFATKGTSGWVKVGLRWPDGEMTEGADVIGSTRESRARGAARAVHRAIEAVLAKRNTALDIEHVMVQRLGTNDSVTVSIVLHEDGQSTPLVGSALIYDDVATAAVHAALHALNRKLR